MKKKVTLITLTLLSFNMPSTFAQSKQNNHSLAHSISKYSKPMLSPIKNNTHQKIISKEKPPKDKWVLDTSAVKEAVSTKCIKWFVPKKNQVLIPTVC